MFSMEKQKQISDYFFISKPKLDYKAIVGWVLGLLFILLVVFLIFKTGWGFNLIYLTGIGVLLYFLYFQRYQTKMEMYNNRPADHQIDEWIEQNMLNVIDHTIEKFGIDENDVTILKAPSLIICFPMKSAKRLGSDGVLRYLEWRFNLFFFMEDSILYYHGIYNHLDSKIRTGESQRIFYKDITNVKVSRVENHLIFELRGTGISLDCYNVMPVRGNNRTNDVEDTARRLERFLLSTKYKTT